MKLLFLFITAVNALKPFDFYIYKILKLKIKDRTDFIELSRSTGYYEHPKFKDEYCNDFYKSQLIPTTYPILIFKKEESINTYVNTYSYNKYKSIITKYCNYNSIQISDIDTILSIEYRSDNSYLSSF